MASPLTVPSGILANRTKLSVSHMLSNVRVITVLFWQLVITAERDRDIEFATVITRAILSRNDSEFG